MASKILNQTGDATTRPTHADLNALVQSYRVTAAEIEDHCAKAYTLFCAISKLTKKRSPESAELALLGADMLAPYRPETAD